MILKYLCSSFLPYLVLPTALHSFSILHPVTERYGNHCSLHVYLGALLQSYIKPERPFHTKPAPQIPNSVQFYCSLKSHTTCCKVRQQNVSSILLASGGFSPLDLLQERIRQDNKMAPCNLRRCPSILLCTSLEERSAHTALHTLISSWFCMNNITSQCPWLPLVLRNS